MTRERWSGARAIVATAIGCAILLLCSALLVRPRVSRDPGGDVVRSRFFACVRTDVNPGYHATWYCESNGPGVAEWVEPW